MECLQVRDCRRARGAGCHGAPLLALKYLLFPSLQHFARVVVTTNIGVRHFNSVRLLRRRIFPLSHAGTLTV